MTRSLLTNQQIQTQDRISPPEPRESDRIEYLLEVSKSNFGVGHFFYYCLLALAIMCTLQVAGAVGSCILRSGLYMLSNA